jgi:hypothetical protein
MAAKFSGLSIGLLIVGLVIGAGSGYVYNSNTLTPIINQLENEVQTLTNQITDKEAEKSALETQLGGIQDDIQDIEDDITQINAEKSQVESEIDSLEDDIEYYEESIRILNIQAEVDEGYQVFGAYGFSFHHPIGMEFIFEEIQEKPISKDYGLLKGNIDKPTRKEDIGISWQKIDFVPDVTHDLDNLVTNFQNQIINAGMSTSLGPKKTITIPGHTLYYQAVTVLENDKSYVMVYTTWYCNIDAIAYRFYYFNYKSTDTSMFDYYLYSLLCHR